MKNREAISNPHYSTPHDELLEKAGVKKFENPQVIDLGNNRIKVVEKQTYEEWKQELINITSKETNTPKEEIKINDAIAIEWYNDGCPAYNCFRENWENDGD